MSTVNGCPTGAKPRMSQVPNLPNANAASQDMDEMDIIFPNTGMPVPAPDFANSPGSESPVPAPHFLPDTRLKQVLEAAETGDVKTLAYLFRYKDVDPKQVDELGRNALHYAAMEGQYKVVDYLLREQRLHPNAQSESGRTPLHYAADGDTPGHVETARLLLQRGALCNVRSEFSQTPLMHACSAGNTDMVTLLLRAGATPDRGNCFGKTPLMDAAAMGHCRVASILLSTGQVAIDHANYSGTTALMMAAREGRVEMVQYLLRKGANPLLIDKHGHNAQALAKAKLAAAGSEPDKAPYQLISEILSTAMQAYREKLNASSSTTDEKKCTLVFTKEPGPFGIR